MVAARLCLAALPLLAACAATPQDVEFPRVPSHALPAAVASDLGTLFGDPGEGELSRFAPVDRADDAFDLRLGLIEAAEFSLDVQTYLWHPDASGSLLLDRLLAAADRGVRVRLLIDGFRVEDAALDVALDHHPNLELRVFNPTLHATGLWHTLELLENLEQYDHRMHDKLLCADGVVALFGGRNVGDEYLGLGSAFDFRDFELLAAGPVVSELEVSFDEFWNSEWVLPLRDVTAPPDEELVAGAREHLRELHAGDARLDGRRALGRDAWLAGLARASGHLIPGRAEVLRDSAHIEREGATEELAQGFQRALEDAGGDVMVVTAYLVPDPGSVEAVRAHVAAGHRVRVLTNSMLTTNQPLAHAFYQQSREAFLDTGVELYELRPDAWDHVRHRSAGSRGEFLGLHAKCAVFGDTHVLVGSMNVDPRSLALNTELGVLVESSALAARVRALLEPDFEPRNAWRVTRREGGLRWTSAQGVLDEEPAHGDWSRFRSWLYSLLPIRGET